MLPFWRRWIILTTFSVLAIARLNLLKALDLHCPSADNCYDFTTAARELNNPLLTNHSDLALARLSYAQMIVESDFNPRLTTNDQSVSRSLFLLAGKAAPWLATYLSLPLSMVGYSDEDQFFREIDQKKLPRLAGYSYGIQNQYFLQAAETAFWYRQYLFYSAKRYPNSRVPTALENLSTQVAFPDFPDVIEPIPGWYTDEGIDEYSAGLTSIKPFFDYHGLYALLSFPDASMLRMEMTSDHGAIFWGTMNLLYAGARQYEGGIQPRVFAIQYRLRSDPPSGRPTKDISSFGLLTTIRSDSITTDFTGWDFGANRVGSTNRIERNQAIDAVEWLSRFDVLTETPNVDANLIDQYGRSDGDFLPYNREEAVSLVNALAYEADPANGLAADIRAESLARLCDSKLLKRGFEFYSAISDAEFERRYC